VCVRECVCLRWIDSLFYWSVRVHACMCVRVQNVILLNDVI